MFNAQARKRRDDTLSKRNIISNETGVWGRQFSKSSWVFIKLMSLRQSRVFSSHPLGFFHMALE